MRVPTVNLKPGLDETESAWKANLSAVLARMNFILGEEGRLLETEFASAVGARFAVGVGNGTAAIEICLRSAGLTSSNHHVLTTPLTAPFTGIGIISSGASIRFADIDPDTLQLDPESTANAIGRRTRAIVPVHLYGQPCRIDVFRKLARDSGSVLIQDAAQAHGARFRDRPLTEYSDFVTYSFYPTKNLGCLGDGGAITTNRKALAQRLSCLRDGGRGKNMVSLLPGINSRLDEVQAALLRAFLPRLTDWNLARARIAKLYDEALGDCPGVGLVRRDGGSVHHLYVVRARRRDKLRAYLAARGIGTGVHYPVPLHLHPAFRDCNVRRGELPHAEKACREIVSLPIWPHLPLADAGHVAEQVRAFYRK